MRSKSPPFMFWMLIDHIAIGTSIGLCIIYSCICDAPRSTRSMCPSMAKAQFRRLRLVASHTKSPADQRHNTLTWKQTLIYMIYLDNFRYPCTPCYHSTHSCSHLGHLRFFLPLPLYLFFSFFFFVACACTYCVYIP